jgi:hypothetical protein
MIPDADDPHQIVWQLLEPLPGGSYLVVSHPDSDLRPEAPAVQESFNERTGPGVRMTTRSRSEVARFFEGLEIAEPGLVPTSEWRPDGKAGTSAPRSVWCAVGRKP